MTSLFQTLFHHLIFISAQLEVENQFFATSLSVLEEQSIDMLIGLDMLRRHRVRDNRWILLSRKTLDYSLVCH